MVQVEIRKGGLLLATGEIIKTGRSRRLVMNSGDAETIARQLKQATEWREKQRLAQMSADARELPSTLTRRRVRGVPGPVNSFFRNR